VTRDAADLSPPVRDEKLRLVHAVSLSAAEQDAKRIVREFRSAARDPDAGVRQAVLNAAGSLPQPGLLELVGELRDGDPADRNAGETQRAGTPQAIHSMSATNEQQEQGDGGPPTMSASQLSTGAVTGRPHSGRAAPTTTSSGGVHLAHGAVVTAAHGYAAQAAQRKVTAR
jgi:hypothetical protein